MLWTSQGMQMWTFGRNAVPPSIKNRSSTPVLAEFGAPVANFQGSCDFDAHFLNHQMIFNIDFCGSNAGETFQMHGCPMVSCASLAGRIISRQFFMLAGRCVRSKLTTQTAGYDEIVGILQHLRREKPAGIRGFVLGGQFP
jgi:hypothetical protein